MATDADILEPRELGVPVGRSDDVELQRKPAGASVAGTRQQALRTLRRDDRAQKEHPHRLARRQPASEHAGRFRLLEVRPDCQSQAGDVAREPARHVPAGRKDAPRSLEMPPKAVAPDRDRFAHAAALVVADTAQAPVASGGLGLTAIDASLPDQMDARADRVVIMNRPVVGNPALGQKLDQRIRHARKMVNVGVDGIE